MKAKELMNKNIEYIKSDATVYDAIEKMVDRRIRSLVVEPKDEKDVYGVITVRDIVFKVLKKDKDPKEINVSEIASKPLICIDTDIDIEHVISLMAQFNIARVFVCEKGKILGVIALLDVMAGSLIKRARGE